MPHAQDGTSPSTPSLARRTARAGVRTALTLGIAVGALYAVQLSSSELARRADAAPAPDAAPVMPVEVTAARIAPGYAVRRVLVGQVEPLKTVDVSFELAGKLNRIAVEEGDAVAAGQVIATLDTQLLDADRVRLQASADALEAQLRFARQTVERQSTLSGQGFASQARLDEALSRADELTSRIAEVQAALTSNAIQIEKSTIRAPFAGVVTERRLDGGESLSPGMSVAQIVQSGGSQLRIGVPLDITQGALAGAKVQVGGAVYDATLMTLRPDVDPVTRTRTALFAVETETALAFGQTARLTLHEEIASPGLWVPVTVLKEGVRGQWTLLAVDAQNIVRSLVVQVAHTDGAQVFVTGAIPEGTRLLTDGPHRVVVGQRVAPHTPS